MVHADWIIDVDPGAGHDGGHVVFEGTPTDLVAARSTLTGEHLAAFAGWQCRSGDVVVSDCSRFRARSLLSRNLPPDAEHAGGAVPVQLNGAVAGGRHNPVIPLFVRG